MIGDQSDVVQRLRLTLPSRWFGEATPVLDAVLVGLSSVWVGLYDLLTFVIQQSRLTTVTGAFLDLASNELLHGSLPRRTLEQDSEFRQRLLTAVQRIGATPIAISSAASAAGFSITMFEAAQPVSTGAYNVPFGLAWSRTGAWGSLQMPLESLIVAKAGTDPHEDELWRNIANAAPAGGALWLSVSNYT